MILLTEFLCFVATFLAISTLGSLLRKKSVSRRYPPSLPSLPIVGSLPFIRTFEDIHEYFRSKSEQLGPIFTFKAGSRLWLILNSRETIEEAFVRNSTCFAGREQFHLETVTNKSAKGIIAYQFSGDFKRYQKIALTVLREFGFGLKPLMERRILEELEAVITAIREKAGKMFDPNELLSLSTYNVIKTIVLGKREDLAKGYDEVLVLTAKFFRNCSPAMDVAPALLGLLPYFKRKADICVKCVHRIKDIIEEDIENIKQDCKVECFVSRYLAQIGPDYDQEQLNYTVRDLMTAGSETTATTLLWLLMFAANNPTIQERLQKEVDGIIPRDRLPSLDDQTKLPFVEATILEILRLRPPVPLAIPHLTLSDSEVCGYFIPKGTKVFANLYAAHMNPAVWKDPDIFRPERFLDGDNKIIGRDGVITFSLGRRSCLGEVLARQELFLFFAGFIQQFNVLPGEDGQQIDDHPIVEAIMKSRPFKIRMIPRET